MCTVCMCMRIHLVSSYAPAMNESICRNNEYKLCSWCTCSTAVCAYNLKIGGVLPCTLTNVQLHANHKADRSTCNATERILFTPFTDAIEQNQKRINNITKYKHFFPTQYDCVCIQVYILLFKRMN